MTGNQIYIVESDSFFFFVMYSSIMKPGAAMRRETQHCCIYLYLLMYVNRDPYAEDSFLRLEENWKLDFYFEETDSIVSLSHKHTST